MNNSNKANVSYKPDLLPSEALHSLLHPKANIPVSLLSSSHGSKLPTSSPRGGATTSSFNNKQQQHPHNPITKAALSSLANSPVSVSVSPRFNQNTYHEHALFGSKILPTSIINKQTTSSLWKEDESQAYIQSLSSLANGTTTTWDHAIQAQQRKLNSAGAWDGSSTLQSSSSSSSSLSTKYSYSSSSSFSTNYPQSMVVAASSSPRNYTTTTTMTNTPSVQSPRPSMQDNQSITPLSTSRRISSTTLSSGTTLLPSWITPSEFNDIIQENRQNNNNNSNHQHTNVSHGMQRSTANVPPKSPRSIPTPYQRSINKGRIRNNNHNNNTHESISTSSYSTLQQYATPPDDYIHQVSASILPLPPLTAGAGISVLRQLSPAVAGAIYFGAFRLLDRDHDGLLKPGDVLSIIVTLKLPYILEAKYLDDHSKLAATMGNLGIDYVAYVRLCHKDTGGRLTGMAAWLKNNSEKIKALPGYTIAPLELDNHGHLTGLFRATKITNGTNISSASPTYDNQEIRQDVGIQTSRPTTTSTTTTTTMMMNNSAMYRKRKPNEYSSNNTTVSTPGAPATPYRNNSSAGVFGWSSVSRPVTSNGTNNNNDNESEISSPRPDTGNSTNSTVYVLRVLPVPMGSNNNTNKKSKYRHSSKHTIDNNNDYNSEDNNNDDEEEEQAYYTFEEEHGRIVEQEQWNYQQQKPSMVGSSVGGRNNGITKLSHQDMNMISTLSTGLMNGPSVFIPNNNSYSNNNWDTSPNNYNNYTQNTRSETFGNLSSSSSSSLSSGNSPLRPVGSRGGLRTALGSRARTPGGLRVDFDIATNTESKSSPENKYDSSPTKASNFGTISIASSTPNPLLLSRTMTYPTETTVTETGSTTEDIAVFVPSASSTPLNVGIDEHMLHDNASSNAPNASVSVVSSSLSPVSPAVPSSSSTTLYTAEPVIRSMTSLTPPLENEERTVKTEAVQISLVLQRYEGAKRLTRIMRRIVRRRKRVAFHQWTDYVIFRIRKNFEKAVITIQKMIRGFLARKAIREHMAMLQLMTQQKLVNHQQYEREQALYAEAMRKAEGHAAQTIQSFWRTLVTEKHLPTPDHDETVTMVVQPPQLPLMVPSTGKEVMDSVPIVNASLASIDRSRSPLQSIINRKTRSPSPVRSLVSSNNTLRTNEDQVQESQFLSSTIPTLDRMTSPLYKGKLRYYPPPDDMDERLVNIGTSVFLPPVQYGKIEIHRKVIRYRGAPVGKGIFLGKLTQNVNPNDEQTIGERVERNLRRRDSHGKVPEPRICDICNELTASRQCYDCTGSGSRTTSPLRQPNSRSVSPGGTSRSIRYCTSCFLNTHSTRKLYRRHQYSDVRQPPGIPTDTPNVQAMQLFHELDNPVGAEVPRFSRKGDAPDRSKTAIACSTCRQISASRACYDCVPAGKPPLPYCRSCFVTNHGSSKVRIVHQYRTVDQPTGIQSDQPLTITESVNNNVSEIRSLLLVASKSNRSVSDSKNESVNSSIASSRATSPTMQRGVSVSSSSIGSQANTPGEINPYTESNVRSTNTTIPNALPGDDFYAGPLNRTVQVTGNLIPVSKPDLPMFDNDRLANNTLQHVSDVPRGRKAIEKMKADGLSLVAGLFDDPNKASKINRSNSGNKGRSVSRSRTPLPLTPSSLRRIEAPIDFATGNDSNRTVVQVTNIVNTDKEKNESQGDRTNTNESTEHVWGFDDDEYTTLDKSVVLSDKAVGEKIDRNVRRRDSHGKVSEPRICDICNELTASRQCYDCTGSGSRTTSPLRQPNLRSVSPGGTLRSIRYCTSCFLNTHSTRKLYRRHQYSDVRQPPGIPTDMNAKVARQEIVNPVGAEVPRFSRKGDIPHPITKPIICTVCTTTTASRGCYDCVPAGKPPLPYCRSCFVTNHGSSKVRIVHQYRTVDQPTGIQSDLPIEIVNVDNYATGDNQLSETIDNVNRNGNTVISHSLRTVDSRSSSPGRLLSRTSSQIIRERVRTPSPLVPSGRKGLEEIPKVTVGNETIHGTYPITEVENENETPRTHRNNGLSDKKVEDDGIEGVEREKDSPCTEATMNPLMKWETVVVHSVSDEETKEEKDRNHNDEEEDRKNNGEKNGVEEGDTTAVVRQTNIANEENPLPTTMDAPEISLFTTTKDVGIGITTIMDDPPPSDAEPRDGSISEGNAHNSNSTLNHQATSASVGESESTFSLTVQTMDTTRRTTEDRQIQVLTEQILANEQQQAYQSTGNEGQPILQLPSDVFSVNIPDEASTIEGEYPVVTETDPNDTAKPSFAPTIVTVDRLPKDNTSNNHHEAEVQLDSSPPSRQGKRNRYRGKGVGLGNENTAIDSSSSNDAYVPNETEIIITTETRSSSYVPNPLSEDGRWHAIWEPNSNAYYYWNDTTGVTQWEQPYGVPIEGLPSVEEPLLEGTSGTSTESMENGLNETTSNSNNGGPIREIADSDQLYYIKGSSGYDANIQSSSVFILQ